MKQALTTLIRDTRLFIQSQLRPGVSCVVPEKPAQSAPQLPVEKTVKLENKPVKKESKRGDWELQPMPPAEKEASSWREKLSVHTRVSEPPLAVVLVLPEENPLHRLFLESVSRAITRSFASACVVVFHEKLFQQLQGKTICVPFSLLKKKTLPHASFKEGNNTWIALEHLDLYTQDTNSKRALWTAIQQSFQS